VKQFVKVKDRLVWLMHRINFKCIGAILSAVAFAERNLPEEAIGIMNEGCVVTRKVAKILRKEHAVMGRQKGE
jgi:hypothetical protein